MQTFSSLLLEEIYNSEFCKFGFHDILTDKPYFCKYQATCD